MPIKALKRTLKLPKGLPNLPGSLGVVAISATLIFTANSTFASGAEYDELPAIVAVTDVVAPDAAQANGFDYRLAAASRSYARTDLATGLRADSLGTVAEFPEAFANGELQAVVVTPAPVWCTFTGLTHLPETHELCSSHGNNTPEQNRLLGEYLTAQRGWEGEQWQCMDNLMMRESRWRHNAANPNTAARGIPQKMMSVHYGADWRTSETAAAWLADPQAQIEWGLNYIERRYQTPCGAWGFFLRNGWY